MYFRVENTLKNNCNHTLKYPCNIEWCVYFFFSENSHKKYHHMYWLTLKHTSNVLKLKKKMNNKSNRCTNSID